MAAPLPRRQLRRILAGRAWSPDSKEKRWRRPAFAGPHRLSSFCLSIEPRRGACAHPRLLKNQNPQPVVQSSSFLQAEPRHRANPMADKICPQCRRQDFAENDGVSCQLLAPERTHSCAGCVLYSHQAVVSTRFSTRHKESLSVTDV